MHVLPPPLLISPNAFSPTSRCAAATWLATARALSPCSNWVPNMERRFAFRLKALMPRQPWRPFSLLLLLVLAMSRKSSFHQPPVAAHWVGFRKQLLQPLLVSRLLVVLPLGLCASM